jgi:hypothetical protein
VLVGTVLVGTVFDGAVFDGAVFDGRGPGIAPGADSELPGRVPPGDT